MTLEAPGRSGLGFYVRSLLEARGEAGEQPQPPVKPEPYPIPDRQLYCFAGFQTENQPNPGGDCGPSINPCPDDNPGSLTGNYNSRYVTDPDVCPQILAPKNFPVDNGADSFPAGCVNYWLGFRDFPAGGVLRNLGLREITPSRGETLLSACSTGSLGQQALGRIDLEMSTARWTITQIDAALNRVYVDGPMDMWVTGTNGFQPIIAIAGQPQNNGYWRMFQLNDAEGWFEVIGSLTAEPAGGQVWFQPAIATVCGQYVSVIDACQSIRIYCNPAGVTTQMHFVFVGSTIYDGEPRPITGIGVDYIEVLSPFEGDDSGDWGAGLWTFNDRGARHTGAFTAVTDPPDRFQAEVRNYTGFELVASESDDTLLRISNSIGYDGDQSVTPQRPFQTPLWVYNNQLYIGDSGGDWQNRAVVLVGGFFSPNKPARVTGTLGLYDGLYSFVRTSPGDRGGVIPNTPFIGTDDGIVEFQGLGFVVDGLPLGYDQENATVIISGTGLYDGTYTGCHVFEFGGFGGVIEDGTLADVWYAGDVATGTFEVTTGQLETGTIRQSFGDGPNFFTSAEPEKSGSFTSTNCIGIRVNVGAGHSIEVGDYFEMFSNAVYTSLCFGTVDTVGPDYIDIDAITFEGNDSGLWNATEPIP